MLNFNIENARECFDKLRTKGVAADNEKRNAIAHILSALVSGAMGEAGLTTVILAAYGNPKTAGGKPVTTVAGLASPKNNISGGDVMRQAWKAAFAVNEMRFYPVTNDDGETAILPVPGADALIASFVNGDKGAPKGIYALKTAIAALQSDAMGDVATVSTPSGEGEGESEGQGESESEAPSLTEYLDTLAHTLRNASVEEQIAAQAAIVNMQDAIHKAFDAIAIAENKDNLADNLSDILKNAA